MSSTEEKITVIVRLHAILRSLVASDSQGVVQLTLPGNATLADVPAALSLPRMEMVYSLNSQIAGEETALHPGDQIDIIPAISGG